MTHTIWIRVVLVVVVLAGAGVVLAGTVVAVLEDAVLFPTVAASVVEVVGEIDVVTGVLASGEVVVVSVTLSRTVVVLCTTIVVVIAVMTILGVVALDFA